MVAFIIITISIICPNQTCLFRAAPLRWQEESRLQFLCGLEGAGIQEAEGAHSGAAISNLSLLMAVTCG